MQDILIVGGHINQDNTKKGNVINVPSNKFVELNMFLDPLAAKTVLSSEHNIILIPLGIQRKVSAFHQILEKLYTIRTPEALFARRLMSRLYRLQKLHLNLSSAVFSHCSFPITWFFVTYIPAICLGIFISEVYRCNNCLRRCSLPYSDS